MAGLLDFMGGLSRGASAGTIGAPVDLATLGLNAVIAGGGYAGHKLGLLSLPPDLIEKPVGGSDWIAEKMRTAGVLKDNPGSTGDSLGELAGNLLPTVAMAKAPKIAKGLLSMADNFATPATLNKQAGVIGFPSDMPRPQKVEAIRKYAEEFAESLKNKGLQATIEHSGSAAGPSSYVNVYNPITGVGTFDNMPFRFSDHSKGAKQSQYVREVRGDYANGGANIDEYRDLLDRMAYVSSEQKIAYDARQKELALKMLIENSPIEIAKRTGRGLVHKANQEADPATYTKAFSNSGKYLGPK
jgi:hypothetical protein